MLFSSFFEEICQKSAHMLASKGLSMKAETRTFTPMLCLNFEITKDKLPTPSLRSQSWMQEGQQAVSQYIGLGPRFARPRPRYRRSGRQLVGQLADNLACAGEAGTTSGRKPDRRFSPSLTCPELAEKLATN